MVGCTDCKLQQYADAEMKRRGGRERVIRGVAPELFGSKMPRDRQCDSNWKTCFCTKQKALVLMKCSRSVGEGSRSDRQGACCEWWIAAVLGWAWLSFAILEPGTGLYLYLVDGHGTCLIGLIACIHQLLHLAASKPRLGTTSLP